MYGPLPWIAYDPDGNPNGPIPQEPPADIQPQSIESIESIESLAASSHVENNQSPILTNSNQFSILNSQSPKPSATSATSATSALFSAAAPENNQSSIIDHQSVQSCDLLPRPFAPYSPVAVAENQPSNKNRMTLQELISHVETFIAAPPADPAAFDALALDIFHFQFEHNPAYRAVCQSQNATPATINSANQIPAIVTSAFKDLDLFVLPGERRTTVFYSSGTIEQRPSRHFHATETLRLYERSLLQQFRPHVLPDVARANFLFLAPPRQNARNSSLVHMFETISTRFQQSPSVFCSNVTEDGNWLLVFENVLRATEKFHAENIPLVICGTAFSFVHLCDFLAEHNQSLTFPNGSRVFETGGYKGRSRAVPKSELHATISRFLGIPETHIISEYGMSELSSQAYDREAGSSAPRVFRFPPWARASVISPETAEPAADGETGLIRVLDLANVGSVMAIQTEDLARRCGDGFELLGRATLAEARGCSLMQFGS
jgi:hypothetical protein